MTELEIDIATPGGAMNTFITHPEESGPHPLIVFLMDAPGKRRSCMTWPGAWAPSAITSCCPISTTGGCGTFQVGPDTRAEMFGHMNSLTNAMACEDVLACVAHAAEDPAARDGAIGVVGYCMSGPFAFAAASAFPDRVAAAASFHGVRLFTEALDSPHLQADRAKAELYFGCAETDEWAPKEMIDGLDAYLREVGSNYRVEWYPGTEHGFVFPLRELYHKESAERHWERLFDLFDRNL